MLTVFLISRKAEMRLRLLRRTITCISLLGNSELVAEMLEVVTQLEFLSVAVEELCTEGFTNNCFLSRCEVDFACFFVECASIHELVHFATCSSSDGILSDLSRPLAAVAQNYNERSNVTEACE